MKIKLVSLMVSIVYLIENTGLYCLPSVMSGRRNALRPAATAISFAGPQESDQSYPVIEKDGAEHTIVGIDHYGCSPKDISRQVEGKGKIIFEGIRSHPHSLPRIMYYISNAHYLLKERIQSWVTGERKFQNFYADRLLLSEGKEIITLDVFYKRTPAFVLKLAIFNLLCLITFCAAVLSLTYFSWLGIPTLALVFLTAIYKLFIADLFDPAIHIIDNDFRDLICATKLSYLPELFGKKDLKTLTIAGQVRQQGIIGYFQDEKARQERWREYAYNPWLRLRLRRYLDIKKSMEISVQEPGTKNRIVIGSIAELPGPKKLIALMKFKAKPPSLADRVGAAILLVPALYIIGVLAILIKLTTRGPAFFPQERIGHNNETVTVWKLTSWTVSGKHELTPIGYIISALHVDELPQLLDILRGKMKFIGPRPLIAKETNDAYRDEIWPIAWHGMFSSSDLVRLEKSLNGLPAINTIYYDFEDAENSSFFYNTALIIRAIYVVFKCGFRMLFNGSVKARIIDAIVEERGDMLMTPEVRPKKAAKAARGITRSIRAALAASDVANTVPVLKNPGTQLKIPKAGCVVIHNPGVDIAFGTAA